MYFSYPIWSISLFPPLFRPIRPLLSSCLYTRTRYEPGKTQVGLGYDPGVDCSFSPILLSKPSGGK